MMTHEALERMMDDPPSREDLISRDIYDQLKWLADGMPLAVVHARYVDYVFDWEVDFALRIVKRKTHDPAVTLECMAHDFGRPLADVEAMAMKLRKHHAFRLHASMAVAGEAPYYRVPPSCRDRLTGAQQVAPTIDERAALAVVTRRYSRPISQGYPSAT